MTAPVKIDVCVCTFRRPQLAETLRSLGAQRVPPGVAVRIVVADNDHVPSARRVVEALRADLPFELTYVHCPAANISVARNACLDAGESDFLAFIDDDCIASSGWLAALLATAEESGADAVLGPVRAIYADAAPGWMRRGDFHSTNPVRVRGEVLTGYTCNVLMRRGSPHLAGRRFDVALGRSGGEDTAFFTGMHRAGGTIVYAEGAVASEAVPAGRARFSWLARRRFRTGQTHGRLLAPTPGRAPGCIALAAAKVAYCAGAAFLGAFDATRRNRALLRGIMHAGVVSGLMGAREITLYGDAAPAKGDGHAA